MSKDSRKMEQFYLRKCCSIQSLVKSLNQGQSGLEPSSSPSMATASSDMVVGVRVRSL